MIFKRYDVILVAILKARKLSKCTKLQIESESVNKVNVWCVFEEIWGVQKTLPVNKNDAFLYDLEDTGFIQDSS